MANESVEAFRRALRHIPDLYLSQMRPVIWSEAEALAEAMRQAAHQSSGATRESIRVVQGPQYADNGQVLVMAGGPLTTRELRAGTGLSYDHVLAEEFGTHHMAAIPFFWPTYRARKDRIAQNIRDAAGRRSYTVGQTLDQMYYMNNFGII